MRRVLRKVLRVVPRLVPYRIPVDESGPHARRSRAHALARAAMWLTSAAMLLMLELAWTVAARAQANVTLSQALVTGAIATNTNWSIAKNGVLASGTVSWTVGVTKISVSDQIIQVDGQFRMTNIGTGPATLGNIVVNLQRPCGAQWVSAAADVADATFGAAAKYGNFVASASAENVTLNQPGSSCTGPGNYVITQVAGQAHREGTLFTTPASGTVDFTNAANNSVFSLVPDFHLAAGASIKLFYTATFDNTILGIAPGTALRPEAIVTVSHAAAHALNVMRLLDADDDDGPSGQGVSPTGDDKGWSQSASTRHSFVPTPAYATRPSR